MKNVEPNRNENIVIMNNGIPYTNSELAQNENQIEGFTKGINLIFNPLFGFFQKATFRTGFGFLTFGVVYSQLQNYDEIERIFMCLGCSFIAATIGGIFDFFVKNKMMKIQKKHDNNKSDDNTKSNVKPITANAV